MIMPTKIVKPVDSIIAISAFVIRILKEKSMNTDELLISVNQKYYKQIEIEKLLLCLDFLYICGRIRSKDDIIELNL